MTGVEVPYLDGLNNQKREYWFNRISEYLPQLAASATYEDLELLFYRLINEGLISDLQQGAPGNAGVITSVTASGLPAGSDPTVALGGTPSERTIALGIPKGDKGEQGEQGIPGPSIEVKSLGSLDLNSITDGEWVQTSSGAATFERNYPSGLACEVQQITYSTFVFQRVQTYGNNGRIYYRGKNGSTWFPWKQLATTDQATTTTAGLMSATDKSKLDDYTSLAELQAYINSRSFIVPEDYPDIQAAAQASFDLKKPVLLSSNITASSLSSIFWSATWVGTGSLTIGTGTPFRPNAENLGQTNNIYYNSITGNDSNSGLSPNAPLKTLQRVIKLLNLQDSMSKGLWQLVIQAGTHQDKLRTEGDMGPFRARFTITGEKGSFGELVTTIDGSAGSNEVAIWLEPSLYVKIKDLRIVNFRSPSTEGNDEPDTGAAIVLKGGRDSEVDNVFIDNCSQGVGVINQGKLYLHGSTINNCATGVRVLYNSTGIIGSSGSPNIITNCTMHGIFVSRNAILHSDYNDISGCAVGIQGDMNSRFATLGGTLSNNTVGVSALSGCEMIIDVDTVFTNNTRDRLVAGVGREARVYSQEGKYNEFCMYRTVDSITVNTTVKSALFFTGSGTKIPPRYFSNKGQKLTFKVNGNYIGSGARDYEVQFRNPSDSSKISKLNFTIPSGKTGRFVATIEMYGSSKTGMWYSIEFRFDNSTPSMLSGSISTLDSSYEWMFAFYVTNTVEGDQVIMRQSEIYMQG